MITPDSFYEQMMFMTVRIITHYDSGIGQGTGFFYGHQAGSGQMLPLIITNRHVIDRAQIKGKEERPVKWSFHLHEGGVGPGSKPTGRFEEIELKTQNGFGWWFKHPDPNVDLAAMMVGGLHDQAKAQGFDAYFKICGSPLVATKEFRMGLGPMESVVVVGYPRGLWDNKNNLPIMRRGWTATHLGFDFCGRKEFVIDAGIYGGSSGSPVFLADGPFYLDRKNKAIHPGERIQLLGVLYAGAHEEADGKLTIDPIPTLCLPVKTRVMMHLGHVIHATEIAALGDYIMSQPAPPTV